MEKNVEIRKYENRDFTQLADVYRSAFAEPPWNEFMKCASCGVPYSKEEVQEGRVYDRIGVEWEYLAPKSGKKCSECGTYLLNRCKNCGTDLSPVITNIVGGAYARTNKSFVEFWSDSDIKKDLELALSQPNNIILVTDGTNELAGFTWGYELTGDLLRREFPFLTGKLNGKTSYMDEIAVRATMRRRGIGKGLCTEYLKVAEEQQMSGVVLRTDQRNVASMNLFGSTGFEPIGIYDPRPGLTNRLYLMKYLRSEGLPDKIFKD